MFLYENNRGVDISYYSPVQITTVTNTTSNQWHVSDWSECSRTCAGGKCGKLRQISSLTAANIIVLVNQLSTNQRSANQSSIRPINLSLADQLVQYSFLNVMLSKANNKQKLSTSKTLCVFSFPHINFLLNACRKHLMQLLKYLMKI